ncbi:MAG TPA: RidA family protein [Flavitalea sp.]|nr:RidA family protein [Flavitalea sp.]
MKIILFIPLFLFPFAGFSQNDSIVKFINPSTVASPKGYSQASVVDLGKSTMVIISGQVPLDVQGNLVGKNDFAKQAEQVFANIKNIVVSQGGKMEDVVKFGMYILDVKNIPILRQVRDKYVNVANPPASTLVQVSSLFRDDIMLEIEATAIIPKKL